MTGNDVWFIEKRLLGAMWDDLGRDYAWISGAFWPRISSRKMERVAGWFR
jgi:hypothetical protein